MEGLHHSKYVAKAETAETEETAQLGLKGGNWKKKERIVIKDKVS